MGFKTVAVGFWLIILSVGYGWSQVMVFPHLADGNIGDGTRWATEIDLVNSSSSPQSVTVSFFNPNGTPKTIIFPRSEGLGAGSTFNLTIAPNQLRVLHIDSAFRSAAPLSTGWTRIQGSGGIEAYCIFRRIQNPFNGAILGEVGFLPHSPGRTIEFIPLVRSLVEGAEINPAPEIAYALANPDSILAASGEIQLFDGSLGQLAATSSFTLPPRSQMAQFISERFGRLSGDHYHVRIVLTSGTVSAVAIRIVGMSLASVPVN